jgi:hypothetical protein
MCLLATLFLRVYDPTTNLASSPVTLRRVPHKHNLTGSFGIQHQSPGDLSWLGGIEVTTRDRYFLDGVLFDIGLRYRLGRVVLEGKHGSWHNIDSAGSVEHYNRLGIEVDL